MRGTRSAAHQMALLEVDRRLDEERKILIRRAPREGSRYGNEERPQILSCRGEEIFRAYEPDTAHHGLQDADARFQRLVICEAGRA